MEKGCDTDSEHSIVSRNIKHNILKLRGAGHIFRTLESISLYLNFQEYKKAKTALCVVLMWGNI